MIIDKNTIVFGVPLRKLVPIISATISVTIGWGALMSKISDAQKTAQDTNKNQVVLQKQFQLKEAEHEAKFRLLEEQNVNFQSELKVLRYQIQLEDHGIKYEK